MRRPAPQAGSPALRAMLWMVASGVLFVLLNAVLRHLAQRLDPFVTQFLRYGFGVLVMLPFVRRRDSRPTGRTSCRGRSGAARCARRDC